MESVGLDMNDIFDDPGAEDSDDGFSVRALPDLQIDQEQPRGDDEAVEVNEQGETNVDVLARIKNLAKGAAKKVVKNPQPKLDAIRLSGARGFQMLPKIFKDVKFKGRGYETQDLDTLMRKYEHWGHRLFPKMTFDEVIERVEKLGSKRDIQTMLKKLRMGIPLLMGEDADDGEEGKIDNHTDTIDEEGESALDAIFNSERQQQQRQSQHQSQHQSQQQSQRDVEETDTADTDKITVTETQKERMERNRQLAMEKRLAKLGRSSQKTGGALSQRTPSRDPHTADHTHTGQDVEVTPAKSTTTESINAKPVNVERTNSEVDHITNNEPLQEKPVEPITCGRTADDTNQPIAINDTNMDDISEPITVDDTNTENVNQPITIDDTEAENISEPIQINDRNTNDSNEPIKIHDTNTHNITEPIKIVNTKAVDNEPIKIINEKTDDSNEPIKINTEKVNEPMKINHEKPKEPIRIDEDQMFDDDWMGEIDISQTKSQKVKESTQFEVDKENLLNGSNKGQPTECLKDKVGEKITSADDQMTTPDMDETGDCKKVMGEKLAGNIENVQNGGNKEMEKDGGREIITDDCEKTKGPTNGGGDEMGDCLGEEDLLAMMECE